MKSIYQLDEKLRSLQPGPIGDLVSRSPGTQYQNAYFEKTLFSIRELLVEFMTSDDPSVMKGKLNGINRCPEMVSRRGLIN